MNFLTAKESTHSYIHACSSIKLYTIESAEIINVVVKFTT